MVQSLLRKSKEIKQIKEISKILINKKDKEITENLNSKERKSTKIKKKSMYVHSLSNIAKI